MSTTQWAERQSQEGLRSSTHTLCLTRNTKSIQKRSDMYSWNGRRGLCLMEANRNLMKTHSRLHHITTHDSNTTSRMLYNRVGSETRRPCKCLLWYTTGREITICEATEWITRHNRGFGSSKRQFMDWKTVTELSTTCWRKQSYHSRQRKR